MPGYDFSSASGSDWGSANFTKVGTDPTSCDGSVGVLGPVAANGHTAMFWNPLTYADSEQVIEVTVNTFPTGDTARFSLLARAPSSDATGDGNHYRASIAYKADGTASLSIFLVAATVTTTLTSGTITGVAAGDTSILKFRCQGSRLLARLWKKGTSEPLLWSLVVADTTYASGYGGVRASTGPLATGTIPTETVDNYSVGSVSASVAQVSFPTADEDPLMGIDLAWTDFDTGIAGMEQCAEYLAHMTSVAGIPFMPVVGPAYDWPNPNSPGLGLSEYIVEQGGIPIISWPRGVRPTDWISGTLAGTYDSVYTQFAQLAAALPGKWVWRFIWELNSNPGTPRYVSDAATDVALWRYVHDLVMPLAPNCLGMCWNCGRFVIDPGPFYPGDAYVAFTGMDVYAQTPPKLFYDACTNQNGNYYQRILQIAPTKPMIIGELGAREQDDPSIAAQGSPPQTFTKAQFYSQLLDDIRRLKADFGGQIVSVCSFNELQSSFNQDWRVTTWPGHYGTLNEDATVNPTVAAWQKTMRITQAEAVTLPPQKVSLAGVGPAYSPGLIGGNYFTPDADTVLHVKNADSSAHTVTVAVPHPRGSDGMSISEAVTVPAGGERLIGPFPADWFADYTNQGLAHVTYDAPTGLTIAALKTAVPS